MSIVWLKRPAVPAAVSENAVSGVANAAGGEAIPERKTEKPRKAAKLLAFHSDKGFRADSVSCLKLSVGKVLPL